MSKATPFGGRSSSSEMSQCPVRKALPAIIGASWVKVLGFCVCYNILQAVEGSKTAAE